MRKLKRLDIAGLLLGFMLSLMAGMAGAVEFTSSGTSCAGNVTIAASGVAACSTGGTALLSSCAGTIIIDAKGVIRCGTPPTCTLTAAPSTIAANASSILTATCTPAATSYTWTGGTCGAVTTNTCTVTPASTTAYTVKGTNSSGAGSTTNATVTVTATAPICTLLPASSTIAPGGSSTLTASCPTATSYTWTGSGCVGSTTTCTVSPASTTTYTVKGTNSVGTGSPTSATVTVSTSATPTCTLYQSFQSVPAGYIRLATSCTPDATSWAWSANTGIASTASSGLLVSPTVTTTYSVTGSNAAGAGNLALLPITVTTPTPVCTLTANPAATDIVGSTSILTASCPTATSYTWTGGTCAGNTSNICTATLAAGITTYTVAGTNSAGTGNTASATVTVAKPICILTATYASIAPGGSSTLTANCPTATSYTWTGGTCVGSTTSCTVSPAATTAYSVAGTNALGLGDPANLTVTVAKPTCTLSAAQSPIVRNGSTTLTANCTPAADSFIWTGGTCAGITTNPCNTGALAGTTGYTVKGTNLAGTSDSAASATVTVQAPSCILTASLSSVAPNGSSNLMATCTPAATNGYTWTGGACAGNTTSTCNTGALATTTGYTVAGKDSVGPGTAASATVTVVADAGCPSGYTYSTVPIDWPHGASISAPLQTVNHCAVKAFQFTMPAGGVFFQTFYSTTFKYISLSQSPYEFTQALSDAGCATDGGPDAMLSTSSCGVTPGATYYLNVRNAQTYNGPDVCAPEDTCVFHLKW